MSETRTSYFYTCDGGKCTSSCEQDFHPVGNICLSDFDVDSCGTADILCPSVQNGSRSCNGSCTAICDVGYTVDGVYCQPPAYPLITVDPGSYIGEWTIQLDADSSISGVGVQQVDFGTRDPRKVESPARYSIRLGHLSTTVIHFTLGDFGEVVVASEAVSSATGGDRTLLLNTQTISFDAVNFAG